MYRSCYEENIQDSMIQAREHERWILDQSISLLSEACNCETNSRKVSEAILYTTRVWVYLIEDLKKDGNQLSKELRFNLISIGLWILEECEQIRLGKSTSYQAIIDVTSTIRDGLK